MEKKLAEYRARKQKEALEGCKLIPSESQKILSINDQPVSEEPKRSDSEIGKVKPSPPPVRASASFWKLELGIFALKAILWCLLMTLFVILEFGAVFFVFSVFYFIYTNFRTSPKKAGEVSAYSVFNPNCEAIDGTLKAEQFEAELKYGATSVR